MNKKLLLSVISAAILATSSMANATLESRLDGDAYYDSDLDITWLTNANISGMHDWDFLMAWVSTLDIDGVTGWRLPSISEMSYLYHTEGVSYFTASIFPEVQPVYYSNEEFNSGFSWYFNFSDGDSHIANKPTLYAAWPVYSGDVTATPVPEPSTYAMLLAGLGLIGFMGRSKI